MPLSIEEPTFQYYFLQNRPIRDSNVESNMAYAEINSKIPENSYKFYPITFKTQVKPIPSNSSAKQQNKSSTKRTKQAEQTFCVASFAQKSAADQRIVNPRKLNYAMNVSK